ncbi:MAG TPA: DUF3857 domain-containing protein [Puia sp.]|nr:DUF3857 domain-containing protein [Puia sp.]
MKPTLLLACLHFILSHITAQEKSPEFGRVDAGDLILKECSFEKSAGAMNLIKTAKISFEVNFNTEVPIVTTEYWVRIKIFSRRGFSAANIQIPYASKSRSSKIKDVEAFIYSLDGEGKVVREKVGKNEIFNEKSNAKRSLNYLAFTFPDLKEGCVIEYRYTRTDKNSIGIKPWFFQDETPTAWSRVTSVVPAYVVMTYHIVPSDRVERDSSYKKYYRSIYNEETRSFTMRNIHSFREEPLMTSLKDNLQRIEFSLAPLSYFNSLYSSSAAKWEHYNFLLLREKFFGLQFDRPIEGTGPFIDSAIKLNSTEDKIAAVYKYVKRNVEWNEEQTFYCDSLEACWRNKSGSNAEINLLFLNLLRKSGVKCYPILISTRDNGNPDTDLPSMSQFNGVDVLAMDGKTIYPIDCTQKQLSFKTPPLNVLNSNGYVVDKEKFGWIFITDPRILMKTEVAVQAVMDSAGIIRGTTKLSFIGFAKSETLAEIRKRKDKPNNGSSQVQDNMPDLAIDSSVMEPSEDDNDTLVQKIGFHFAPSNTDKFYFLNPFLFADFSKNPFIDTLRFSDIDFGCNQSSDVQLRIKIPANLSVESLPGNVALYKQDSSILFERKIFMDNGYLTIHNFFILKNAVFIKEDYHDLKAFFDKFYGLFNEEILLKKKN